MKAKTILTVIKLSEVNKNLIQKQPKAGKAPQFVNGVLRLNKG